MLRIRFRILVRSDPQSSLEMKKPSHRTGSILLDCGFVYVADLDICLYKCVYINK